MLESYVLIQQQGDIELLKFEALRAQTHPFEIKDFVYGEPVTFADQRIAEFWALYDSFAPDFKWQHREFEQAERRRFVKRSLYAAAIEDSVVGGIWVDTVHVDRSATIHIFVAPAYQNRGIGTALLRFFEADVGSKYPVLSCVWGLRTECNPAALFAKNGYVVTTHDRGGIATKQIRDSVPTLQPV